MSELPKGWLSINTGSVFSQISTTKLKVKSKDTLGAGIYPVVDQGAGFIAGYTDDETKVISVSEPICIFGDHTRTVKWIDFDFVPGADGTKVLVPNAYLFPKFFYYQLRSLEIEDRGYSRHFKYLKATNFKVAPLNEQIRIANKLDSILAKVDKAQARLDKIPAILKRFRQSVLAAATSGELTKEWREASSGLNEALADYADKIENGRFDSWVQLTLRDFEKKGKLPKNDKWKEKYSCKRSNLEPEGRVKEWNYENLDYLADVIDPNPKHRNPKYIEEGYHFISTAQFDGYDGFDLSNCKFVALDTIEEQKERCNFSSRSIAVSRKGTIGETRILDLNFPFALLDSVCVVNIDRAISHRYLNYALRGEWVQKQIYSKTKGVALKQVSVGAVRELVIPIPIYSEQCEIVNKLDFMLSKAAKIEKQYFDAKARLDRLTQSILAKAFRGELAAQDPNDEPAEKLLERILAEKKLIKPKKVTRKRIIKAKTVEKE